MEDSNPQGTGKTVDQAAASIFDMLEPQQPEGQVEERQEEETAEYVEESEPEEVEASEETQEEVEEPPRYRVKVGSEELEVDLDELIKGYSRTSDYTKKTQTLAEQRKAIEAEKARIEEAAKLRDQYAQRLAIVEQMLVQPEENLSELKETDPIAYAVKVAERAEREKQLAAVRQERQQLAMRQQADQQERLRTHLSSEAEKLKAAIPEMADEVKGEVIRKEIKDFARSIGFSEQELASVYDHRAVLTLYNAMQWQKLQQGKPQATKKVAEAPKMLKAGTTGKQSTAEQDAMKKMRAKLAKTGDRRDAARLFEKFI